MQRWTLLFTVLLLLALCVTALTPLATAGAGRCPKAEEVERHA